MLTTHEQLFYLLYICFRLAVLPCCLLSEDPWVKCTGIRTLNPGFRESPLAHGYKTDAILAHRNIEILAGEAM